MIAPHRANRTKTITQDRRRLSRYTRRWVVERFFAWIQWQRRVLVRWEYHPETFLGFVLLQGTGQGQVDPKIERMSPLGPPEDVDPIAARRPTDLLGMRLLRVLQRGGSRVA